MSARKITAAELMEQLKNDKEYQEKRKKREIQINNFQNMLDKDSKPLLEDLEKIGIKINSIWDLVNTSEPYPKAIPILIEHLKKPYHLRIKAGIARSLAVKEAKDIAWSVLVEEYLKAVTDEEINEPSMRGYKEGLAAALSYLMDDTKIAIVLDLIQDKKHKSSRILFLDALAKYKTNPKIKEIVRTLKDDNDLKKIIKEKF